MARMIRGDAAVKSLRLVLPPPQRGWRVSGLDADDKESQQYWGQGSCVSCGKEGDGCLFQIISP